MMLKLSSKTSIYVACFILLWAHSLATIAADAKENFEFIATVNGVPITKGLLDLNVNLAIGQGQKDSPQLRESMKNELISRELIAQAATKEGLARDIDLTDQITQMKQTLLVQAYLEAHFKQNPISDAMLKEEYEKQKQALGGGTSVSQFKVSQIVLSTESAAIAVSGRLAKGDDFSKVAQEVSIDDATKVQGGSLGWVSPGQLLPAISTVMTSLKKGTTSSPIQIQGGWVIIRVEDSRSAKIASLEASKPQLRQAIIQQYLNQTLKRLSESAKFVR
ncbi:peptidylprolyl isomerase [Polynucleobacter corsicus]|uniref:peptidylprolyl isomerase n=1 Tax=Polynucleobacter corsicus TaxID=2081042 RepID=UPI001BFE499F|nr:peptidylprolyl isomerase [Polynucleobacter corsicus]QWE19377.1 peptidylprolyl isomerase [Polynucleobacter corsicus]